MGMMRLLGRMGDSVTTWRTEEREAVEEAERIFNEARAKGYVAFETKAGTTAGVKVDRFNPEAEEIRLIPRIAGG